MTTGKLPLIQIAGTSANFYEHCYVNCQPDANGCISAANAAELLKTSGLPETILSEIWESSDSSSKGFLTKYEFHVALKLVALAQHKLEPKLYNLQMSISSPILNVNSSNHNPNATISPINVWTISVEEQNKYSKVFDSLDSVNGKLSGEAVKPVFINSKLPVATLGQVWTLSDIDKDGFLDRDEFILAMHLIYKSLTGEEPPKSLHTNLIPPSKRRPTSVNSIQSSFKANTSGSLQSSFLTSSLRLPSLDWVVGKLEKERYDTQFFAADKDKDGLLSGLEIRDTFVQSGLPQNVLARIWDLCDVNKSGMLNSEQFALAMHLINDQISSAGTKPIPSVLSAEMVPPSLRSKTNDSGSVESLTLASFGLKAESDDVYKEIESIRRERSQVEQVCRQAEADYKFQVQEVAELQEKLDRTTQTAQTLSKQKEEAQHRLDELTEQKNRTQTVLDETRHKCSEEREQLESLRRQIGCQSASIDEKRDDLKRLQVELNELIREEAGLREQVRAHHSRLAAIEAETASTEAGILAADGRNRDLEMLRGRLQEVLAEYEAVLASPGTAAVPEATSVDRLVSQAAASLAEHDRDGAGRVAAWPAEDPFMKDDPFSAIADPFSGGDPFAASGDPFSGQQDPFSLDPFAANNGWTPHVSDSKDAFSIGNVDDIFKNMAVADSTHHNHFDSNLDDPFGFGDSPFDNAPEKNLPPPRPAKAPPAKAIATPVSTVSELEQMSRAKLESQREAREAEAARRQEEADLEKALRLSKEEYRTQERKKVPKGKK